MSSYVHTSAAREMRTWITSKERSEEQMRMTSIRNVLLIIVLAGWNGVPASAQTAQGAAAPLANAPGEQVRRLTIDEAVRLALENNLGIQVARINPQIQDLAVALARAAWVPTFNTTVQGSSVDTP